MTLLGGCFDMLKLFWGWERGVFEKWRMGGPIYSTSGLLGILAARSGDFPETLRHLATFLGLWENVGIDTRTFWDNVKTHPQFISSTSRRGLLPVPPQSQSTLVVKSHCRARRCPGCLQFRTANSYCSYWGAGNMDVFPKILPKLSPLSPKTEFNWNNGLLCDIPCLTTDSDFEVHSEGLYFNLQCRTDVSLFWQWEKGNKPVCCPY